MSIKENLINKQEAKLA